VQELDALRTAFARIDVEGRGELSLHQLREAFNHIGMDPTNDELDEVLGNLRAELVDERSTFTFADFAQACDFLSPVQ
jgi:Ca2+-binding EF-hand superfamily protein